MKKALTTKELRETKVDRHEFVKIQRNKIILFLDRLLNNHNLGAILRIADAGLVEKVISHDVVARVDGRKAVATSKGVAEWVPHEQTQNGLHGGNGEFAECGNGDFNRAFRYSKKKGAIKLTSHFMPAL